MLQNGARVGPYEISGQLGAGGMGEVYRARDTRLERSVAIKVLSTGFAGNSDLRARFEREARTISQLNHPNICTLYDVGHEDGLDYLVMELLDGETLADRMEKGPLPLPEVLRYGAQIADALARAHRHGITHRDLKPANVMLTKSGAKLLDFGLAKTLSTVQPSTAADAATQHKPLTQEGTILGTFQYMAPEQLTGEEADARSDIFTLGAVLYEMATGARAFTGKNRTSLVASILAVNPRPISELQPLTAPSFERLVQRCLAKDPDERWQSAADVAEELKWIAKTLARPIAPSSQAPQSRRPLALIAAVLVSGLAIGAMATWLSRAREPRRPVVRFAVPAPAQAPIALTSQKVVAISPDGLRIVYRGETNGVSRLYLRRLAEFTSIAIPGTEDVTAFTFSPDGKSIAFIGGRKLKRLSLDGGIPVTLDDRGDGTVGIDWYGDTIYYPINFSGGIHAIPAAGGKSRPILRPDPGRQMRAVLWPHVIADGDAIIATGWNNTSWDEARIVVHSIKTGKTEVVVEGGTCARYVSTGHILFGRGDSLFAVPFDLKTLRTTGAAVPVINGITNGVLNGEYQYATSADGALVYVPGSRIENDRVLVWADAKGEQPVVQTQRPYADPALSPDGASVAVTLETATFDVWQLDIARDAVTRVSFGGDDLLALWTVDGQRIIWASSRSGAYNLYWTAADGSTGEQRLTSSSRNQFPNDLSPDGTALLFSEDSPGTQSDLWLMPLSGARKPEAVVQSRFRETGGQFSPDGRWLLYGSDESGRPETYVRPYPQRGGKWQVSTGGADNAIWTGDGRAIMYRQGTKIFRVPIETAPRMRVGTPQLVMDRHGYADDQTLSTDGVRLLRVKESKPASASQFYVVLNWFDELKQRLRPAS
ncbi:MAG TPA: protein kinase [Thermoanaerobaculia bacterium]|nr:protein kinase [Thermoanaerobaculia bacterium]